MQTAFQRDRFIGPLVVTRFVAMLVLCLAGGWSTEANAGADDYQAYCLYKAGADYPDGNPPYDQDVQGIGHDDENWFITQTEDLWKIPAHYALGSVDESDPGVLRNTIAAYPEIHDPGYRHFGDPVTFHYDSRTFLFVPIENDGIHLPGAVAVFRSYDLGFIDYAIFPSQVYDAGWCAIDDAGFLYSSRQHASSIFKYSVDWDRLVNQHDLVLTEMGEIPIYDESGQNLLDLVTMQGGEFAPGSKLLYLLSGFHDDDANERVSEGIHVMDTTTWRRVAHSTNGYGYFNYDYSSVWDGEPEGLTVWDLDNGLAPNVSGQLHVFMLDNEIFDDVTLYHYTNVWRVDRSSPCSQGEPTCAFRTVTAAHNVIFPRSEMRIQAGTYLENLALSKPMRVTAKGGLVRIGN
ncbi:MAG: hypothetical protein KDA27_27895 [Candidatus Eisenbacteria bacterium]|uniref:Uncharacterized protein n=1 Tax=Eiseniibacteriota bacterium TaxID=2212470 RepID=A0A956SGX3_UNCEI|nr:hypothetical protein [Candidatus Eisenbacteria bacterium]